MSAEAELSFVLCAIGHTGSWCQDWGTSWVHLIQCWCLWDVSILTSAWGGVWDHCKGSKNTVGGLQRRSPECTFDWFNNSLNCSQLYFNQHIHLGQKRTPSKNPQEMWIPSLTQHFSTQSPPHQIFLLWVFFSQHVKHAVPSPFALLMWDGLCLPAMFIISMCCGCVREEDE